MASSSGNHIQGRIAGISSRETIIELEITAVERFIVHTTPKSFASLDADIGAEVHITFKPSDVYVLPADPSPS
jgi:molybdopterin-binding protein